MAWAQAQAAVQGTHAFSASALTVPYGSNVTAGNLLVVVVFSSGSSPTFTVTDTLSTSYRSTTEYNVSTNRFCQIFYKENCGSGANTVSVLPSVSAGLEVIIMEWSNDYTAGDPKEGESSSNHADNTTPPTTGSITVTTAGDLVIAACLYATASNGGSWTPSSGFTAIWSDTTIQSSFSLANVEYKVASAAQTDQPVYSTPNNSRWVAVGASFKPAATSFAGDEEGITFSYRTIW